MSCRCFSIEAAVSRRHNLPPSPRLGKHVHSLPVARKRKSVQYKVRLTWPNFSSVPGSLSFRHARISLPVGGFWELLHHSILFYFILFSILFFNLPSSLTLFVVLTNSSGFIFSIRKYFSNLNKLFFLAEKSH